MAEVQQLISILVRIPPAVAYLLLGLGSAIENVFPPIPSDTVVVLGGVLADRGGLHAPTILLVAWLSNVGGALIIYALARRFGPGFFEEGWGTRLLKPHQFARVSSFYARHGLWAIFFSRFLPVLRVVIPTFAGFAHLGFVRTTIPLATASLLWYGVLLFLGIFLSRNLHYLFDLVGAANSWLLG
ncbi:MAG: DedA family protein, partial [Gemmatimonadota bacterium]